MSTEAAPEQETPKMGLGGTDKPPAKAEQVETVDPTANAMAAFEELGQTAPPPSSEAAPAEEQTPPEPPVGIPPDAPQVVKDAVTPTAEQVPPEPDEEEKDAAMEEVAVLDFLLGDHPPQKYEVEANVIIGDKIGKLTFYYEQQDAQKIMDLETEYGVGMGPFGGVDRIGLAASIADAAVYMIKDGTGREIDPESFPWRGKFATGADAWKHHFKHQYGTLQGVVDEIRIMSGITTRNVGQSQKVKLADAVGNS